MKKFISIVVIIVVAIVALWFIKTPIIAGILSSKLKTSVSIGDIFVTPSHITIKNFKIKNPTGFSGYALRTKTIRVDYSMKKLFSSPSIIDKVLIDDINLDVECTNPVCSKNNWTGIMNNVSEKESKSKSDTEVIIRSFVMKDMKVQIGGMGLLGKTQTKTLDHIEFNNINSKDGFPTQQLISAIFRSAGLKDYLKGLLEDGPEGILKTFGL